LIDLSILDNKQQYAHYSIWDVVGKSEMMMMNDRRVVREGRWWWFTTTTTCCYPQNMMEAEKGGSE